MERVKGVILQLSINSATKQDLLPLDVQEAVL